MLWNRKEFKRKARSAVKRNYWQAVAVCFILAFLGCEYTSSTAAIHQYDPNIPTADDLIVEQTDRLSNYELIRNLTDRILGSTQEETGAGSSGLGDRQDRISDGDKGVSGKKDGEGREMSIIDKIRKFVDSIGSSTFDSRTEDRGYLFRLLRAVYQFVIGHKILSGFIFLLAALLSLGYSFLAANPLIVGKRRFFLDNNRAQEAEQRPGIRRIFYCFTRERYWKTVKVMFFRDLFIGLWSLTIIGGIIKFYEYRPIPFLAAEHPDMDRKEIFALAKEMMRGYKWNLFIMDLSFLGWEILEVLTLGLAGIFYAVPYMSAAEAEMYLGVKEGVHRKEKD